MSASNVVAAENTCLPTIALLVESLAAAFGRSGKIQLDLSEVALPDLSVLQLVQSARATAKRDGRAFALTAPADARLTALLDRAGITSGLSVEDTQFWFHGDIAQ